MARTDILMGTLTLLILKSVSRQAMHGYGITQRIEAASGERLRVEEGSLYPALHRLEEEGWIRSEWGMTESNRKVRMYSLTAKGRKKLAVEEKNWERLSVGVRQVLDFA